MKTFKITGICVPEEDFMVDTSGKIAQIMTMIRRKDYFVINRPRQYGKTTTLALLERELLKTDDYLPIFLSFEGVDGSSYENPKVFCSNLLKLLSKDRNVKQFGYDNLFLEKNDEIENFTTFSSVITDVLSKIEKKIVLMIDEVDKSSDNQIFLYFLGMLREKYLKSQMQKDTTFHSVILAGLHDIKSLKMKIYSAYPPPTPPINEGGNGSSINVRGTPPTFMGGAGGGQGEAKYNSPWNIAVDFEVDMSFTSEEISTMLSDYTATTGFQMDILAVSERIHFWTNGYPFLVSKLCKMIDEKVLPKRENKNWGATDIDDAANNLLKEINTLFEDFAKNLQNKPDVSDLIEHVILGRNDVPFDLLNPVINFAYMYGMIRKNEYEKVSIHNKIFEERMTSYFITKYALQY
ncbi:MAG: AAA-like domain-containing protein, partial [Candidatus Cloacimonetes bacterium]|nr:AAA-like domain-containing protein [Candidatus Cloacimonadota bacterium]